MFRGIQHRIKDVSAIGQLIALHVNVNVWSKVLMFIRLATRRIKKALAILVLL
jgi:hypothetical protein